VIDSILSLATYWLTSVLVTQVAILKLTYVPSYIISHGELSFSGALIMSSLPVLYCLLRTYWCRWVSNIASNFRNSQLVFHAVKISFCMLFLLPNILIVSALRKIIIFLLQVWSALWTHETHFIRDMFKRERLKVYTNRELSYFSLLLKCSFEL